ncbi:MAG: CPBP family intramembrane metalloprotease [Bacteroidota bacterium]|nr:CPBP family intramembrane metalloprotease [Bacteroidota bacterium]
MNPEEEQKPENSDDDFSNIPLSKDLHSSKLPPHIKPAISPVAAGFIGLAGAFILYQFIGGLLLIAIFGFNIQNIPTNPFRWLSIASQMLFILLPGLLFAKWFYKDVTYVLRAYMPDLRLMLIFVVGLFILIPLLNNYLIIQQYFVDKFAAVSPAFKNVKDMFDTLDNSLSKTYGELLGMHSPLEFIVVVLLVGITPAICEEVMFRGFIQHSFEFAIKPLWAILITSTFFGLYHFSPYGLLPLIGLGFYFGFAAYKTNSILPSMVMHFLNNFTAVLLYMFAGTDDLSKKIKISDQDLWFSVLSFVILLSLFIFVMYFQKKYTERASTQHS